MKTRKQAKGSDCKLLNWTEISTKNLKNTGQIRIKK